MTGIVEKRVIGADDASEISMLAVGSVLLRARKAIISAAVIGGILGLSIGLMKKRMYNTVTTFIPQGSESGASGLALAASQFGLTVPGGGGGWGPPIYIEVLRSREVLEPLATATVAIPEMGGKRVPVMEILDIKDGSPATRLEHGVDGMRGLITASEDKKLGAVRITVSTRWPSFSLWVAQSLVQRVDQFNLETRKSQAASERKFVESQAAEAEKQLRASEDRLQAFRQQNRIIVSPELVIMQDRLERDVGMNAQIYQSLLKSREEARIREVRDTPVLTVIEAPHLPLTPQSRGTLRKGILGGFAGTAFGIVAVLLTRALATLRHQSTREAREFIEAFDSVKPRVFRRGN